MMATEHIEQVFLAAKKVLDTADWEHGDQDQALGELQDAVWQALGLCEVCDKKMPDNYPYSVCPSCEGVLKDAMNSPIVRVLTDPRI